MNTEISENKNVTGKIVFTYKRGVQEKIYFKGSVDDLNDAIRDLSANIGNHTIHHYSASEKDSYCAERNIYTDGHGIQHVINASELLYVGFEVTGFFE